MNLTEQTLMLGTGCVQVVAEHWLPGMQAAMNAYGIESPQSVAAFLANVGVESGGLSHLVENMNYSAHGLAATWPNRYAVDMHAAVKVPNDLANTLAMNPMHIANNVYANRLGNGDEESGDGWNYRGQGPIQITGKAQIAACLEAINALEGSEYVAADLQLPLAGSLSAAWYFQTRGCIALADSGDINSVIQKINGQAPCIANSGQVRITRYIACLNALQS